MKIRIRTVYPGQLAEGKRAPKGQEVRVENAETGELIDNVVAVSWSCDGRPHESVCLLTIRNVDIDVVAKLQEQSNGV